MEKGDLIDLSTTCLVVGGGPGGYGAAMASLREGCATLLVERHGFLGGMGTAAGLSCYINYSNDDSDLAGSVYQDLIASLALEGQHYHDAVAQADFFEPEACKLRMEANVLSAGGSLLYHCLLQSVRRVGDRWELGFLAKGAGVRISCDYVVDATGDGDVSALGGARMTHGRRSDGKSQPMSMVVQLGGFDPREWSRAGGRLVSGRFATAGDCFAAEIAAARSEGEWTIPRRDIAMFWSMPADPTRVTINGTRINGFNACHPVECAQAEVEGRRQAREILRLFRKRVPGFARAYLLQTGPQVGVRESRRIVGRATLTEEDVRRCVRPASSVVDCAYPIDVHHPEGAGTQFEKPAFGARYGIPWECLLPENIPNLVAAGRCISATHEAAGSFRVMPTCMGLGEAAGTGVGLAARKRSPLHAITGEAIRHEMNARKFRPPAATTP